MRRYLVTTPDWRAIIAVQDNWVIAAQHGVYWALGRHLRMLRREARRHNWRLQKLPPA